MLILIEPSQNQLACLQ